MQSRALTRAVLSLLEVMRYVPSGLSCISVISPRCASSTELTSSPFFTSYLATLPFSCPVRMKSDRGPKRATVAFEPGMMISMLGVFVSTQDQDTSICAGSEDERAGPSSRLMGKTLDDVASAAWSVGATWVEGIHTG